MDESRLEQFLTRLDGLIDRLDGWLPPAPATIDWRDTTAASNAGFFPSDSLMRTMVAPL